VTGIRYYLEPRYEKLYEPIVWTEAAVQVFFSIGVGFGVHLTYASFNEHKNNCYRYDQFELTSPRRRRLALIPDVF
jgi:solute carrier family 6 noradrenalin transporter-like protein 2